eukprot:g8945.t1
MESSKTTPHPKFSERIIQTDTPTIVYTKKLMSTRKDALSLAQGIVYWKPPPEATVAAAEALRSDAMINSYGPDEGMPKLRAGLRKKIKLQNGLDGYDVIITSGANQAFVNCLLAFCDTADGVVLFKPYYFNHLMAVQMTGSSLNLIEGHCNPHTLQPDLDWLEKRFSEPNPPSLVVLVNPCNPTGILMSKESLTRAAEICEKNRAWLIVDDTYEDFVYEGRTHHCINSPNVIHIFSFSKAYGMMGWRIGYIAYPDHNNTNEVGKEIVKAQDTIAICASQIGQHVALAALAAGPEWVNNLVKTLDKNRRVVLDALTPLGDDVAGGEGALYIWAKLPESSSDDVAVVEWLVKKHGVCLIPGSSCGAPGFVRIAFGNQPYEVCKEAAKNLRRGLEELVQCKEALNVSML